MLQIFVVHGGLPMDPIVTLQDINAVDRPCERLTFLDMARVTLEYFVDPRVMEAIPTRERQPHQSLRSCKVSTRLRVLTCLALGERSLQLATCHSQTNPPSMNNFLPCGTQHRRHDVPIKHCALMGCLRGRDAARLQM